MITHQKTAGNWKSRVAFFSQKMGLYLGLPQDNYPGRRPQAPACFKYAFHCRLTAHIRVCNLDSKPNEQNRSSINLQHGNNATTWYGKVWWKKHEESWEHEKKLDPLNFERPSRCSMVFPGLWLVQSWNSDPNHKPFQPSKGSVR